MTISVLGIDIGKNNFHLFGVDVQGSKVIRKNLSRKNLLEYVANLEPCIIANRSSFTAQHAFCTC